MTARPGGAVPLHHRIDGPAGAAVLVMAHPLGSALAMWEPQVPELARRFRVVRCDLRGHGKSPAPAGPYEIADLGADLVALLDRLGAARAHLCGLSLGGMVSMWVAAHHPGRVGRMVLCCTSAELGPPQRWVERAAAARAGGTDAVADDVVARWFTPSFRARHPEIVAAHRATIAASPAEGYIACCGAIERMDLRPDLGSIRAPTLTVAGADDPSTPPEHLLRIAQAIPGARAVVVQRAAHLANVEQPDQVTALIDAHLRADLAASDEETQP